MRANTEARNNGPEGSLKRAKIRQSEKQWRIDLRYKAIAAMGGKCEWCEYDHPLALTFDHIEALRRIRNGIARNRHNSTDVYKQVLRGDTTNLQLLCANGYFISGPISFALTRHEAGQSRQRRPS